MAQPHTGVIPGERSEARNPLLNERGPDRSCTLISGSRAFARDDKRARWRTASTLLCLALVVLSLGLQACGRKEKLTPPRGADYPRQYPRE